jgi:KUP system potassium uptake protein
MRPLPPPHQHPEAHPTGRRLAVLTLTALGVVYGDIGTSPLYAFRECFKPEYGLTPTPETVYGLLSLILWALVLVVTVKYVTYILAADNKGEGGIFAMLALVLQKPVEAGGARRRFALVAIALFGAALLYGDGIITPAISVLGAMEGLVVVSPAFEPAVVPLTLVILVSVFAVQRFGTAKVGSVFGPLMLVWFATIAVLGLKEIALEPRILAAVNPLHGVRFLVSHGTAGFLVLGAVCLAVTGAEALYADMGHFGRRPIRLAWLALVLPALVINYFGQGALVLRDPSAADNPFFRLAPAGMLYPLIAIATMAAIIASQALISGAYSLTQQCIQLGYAPRLTIKHTSAREAGQIYIPEVNLWLAVGCVLVVLGFRSSTALGAAYGIAVTGTMLVTTILFFVIARRRWHWPWWHAGGACAVFVAADLALFGANAVKVPHGGWVPLAVAAALFTLMTTWKRGRVLLRERLADVALPLEQFLDDIGSNPRVRVSGTAVFMTSEATGVPVVLLHHLKHNKVLHDTVVLLSIVSESVPFVDGVDRLTVEPLDHGFWRLTARYGFMETPEIPVIMELANKAGIRARSLETSYYLGREQLLPVSDRKLAEGGRAPVTRMATWRKGLFSVMSRNARSATEFFKIPPNRVVELGTQIQF